MAPTFLEMPLRGPQFTLLSAWSGALTLSGFLAGASAVFQMYACCMGRQGAQGPKGHSHYCRQTVWGSSAVNSPSEAFKIITPACSG